MLFVRVLAAIAHELPQEPGDFAILLDAGYSRTKALALNTLSSLADSAIQLALLLAGIGTIAAPHLAH